MKTFSDLLDTKFYLTVVVNGNTQQINLLDSLEFAADAIVEIDGIKVLPKYNYLAVDRKLIINEPFYCWYHKISGQGWLLTPR